MDTHYQDEGMYESTVKMMYSICQLVNNIVVIVQQQEEENRQWDEHFQDMMNNMCDQMALSNSSPNKIPNNKSVDDQPTCPKPSNSQVTRKITPNQVLPKRKILLDV